MILGLRHYATKASAREPLLRFMLDGLRAAGCRVLFASPPDRAPFVITFETRDGERMGIVAYAAWQRRALAPGGGSRARHRIPVAWRAG